VTERVVRVALEMVVAQYEAAAASAGASTRTMAAEIRAAAAQIAEANGVIGASASRAAAETEAADSAAAASSRRAATEREVSATRQTKALKEVGKVGVEMGALLVGIFAAATIANAHFEKQISATGAITGATKTELQSVRDLALELGSNTPFSATKVAEAMNELAKNGITVQQILHGAAKAAIDLATANDAELAPSAELVSNAMDAFALKASVLPHIADTITGATHAGAGSLTDFQYALSSVGPTAKAAGLSIEDASLAIAEFGKNGLHGSTAGTGLKDVLMRIANPTKEAASAMKDLGLMTETGTNLFFDQTGKLKSLRDIQELLKTSLAGVSDQQRIAAEATIFGVRGIQEASIMARLGAEGFDRFAQSMSRITADEATRQRMDNLAGDFKKLGNTFETAFVKSGSTANDAMRLLAQGMTGLVKSFSEMPAPLQATAVGIAGIGGTVLLLGGMVGTIVPKVRRFREELELLGPAGVRANTALGVLGKTALVGAAVVVAADLFEVASRKIEQHALDAVADTSKLVNSLQLLAETGQRSGELTRVFGTNLGGLSKAIKELQDTSSRSHWYDFLSFQGAGKVDVAERNLKTAKDNLHSLDEAMAQMVQSGNARGAKDVFDQLAEAAKKGGIPVKDLRSRLKEYQNALSESDAESGKLADGSLNALGEQAAKTGQSVSELDDQLKAFGDTLKGLNNPLYDANDASIKYAQSLTALKTSLAENGKNWDLNTEAGQKNVGALDDLGRAAVDLAQKQAALNGTSADMASVMETARSNLVDVLVQMGMNRSEAQSLAETYLKIPASLYTDVNNNIPDRIPDAATYANILAHIPASVRTDVDTYYHAIGAGFSAQSARNQTDPAYRQADGGVNIRSFANGGFSALPGYARIAPRGTLYQYAESDGAGESFVPLAQSKRTSAERVLSDTAHLFGGAYLAGGSTSSGPSHVHVTSSLDPADRALFREAVHTMKTRPVSVEANGREVARIAATGTRTNRRR
jgi:TP901 family phage tail tape measure protein